MPGGKSFYRGGRRNNWFVNLAIVFGMLLLLLAVWLFVDMQRYIVYDKDGVHVMTAAEAQAGPQTAQVVRREAPRVEVELVVDPTDYTAYPDLDTTGLTALRGRFLAAQNLTENALSSFATGGLGDYDTLVLELKTPDGALHWRSGIPLAVSYDLDGSLDLAEPLAKLKEERDVRLVAQLSCLVDGSMSARNNPVALRNADGAIYLQDGLGWLDPYAEGVRNYLSAMMANLAQLGFDEILFTGLNLPEASDMRFSSEMTQTPDPASAVSSLSFFLRREADALGLKISAYAENESFHQGEQGGSQNLTAFFKAFDRVYYSWDYGGEDRATALALAMGSGNAGIRTVPISSGQIPSKSSYVIR